MAQTLTDMVEAREVQGSRKEKGAMFVAATMSSMKKATLGEYLEARFTYLVLSLLCDPVHGLVLLYCQVNPKD